MAGIRVGHGDAARMVGWVQAGSGHPTVLLAAGRNDTVISWAPLLAPLAASTRVVAYDAPGWAPATPIPGQARRPWTGRSPTRPR